MAERAVGVEREALAGIGCGTHGCYCVWVDFGNRG
jgi:hypothetical protein